MSGEQYSQNDLEGHQSAVWRTAAATMSPRSGDKSQPGVAVKFVSAGLAGCVAESVTIPFDTTKVRLQVQGEKANAVLTNGHHQLETLTTSPKLKYRGLLRTVYVISAEEGVRSLYGGLVAALQRQLIFASIRLGYYDKVKQLYIDNFYGKSREAADGSNILLRIAAGITTGAIALSVAQPTDLVKIRMQSARGRYEGCLHAYRTIVRDEGVRGLWKGALPNITRNAIVNAAELVSYDIIKETLVLRRRLMNDDWPCHFVSAFGAGFCATCVASPVDVVKTRYMNSSAGVYRGALHCAASMLSERGVFTFYKGFIPAFMRIGTWNIVMFVTFEQLKRLISQHF